MSNGPSRPPRFRGASPGPARSPRPYPRTSGSGLPRPNPGASPAHRAPPVPSPGVAEAALARLPMDAMARALFRAAQAVADVFQGRSLTDAAQWWRHEQAPLRAQAQDLAYWTLRRHGWGDYILSRLLERPLPPPPDQQPNHLRALLLVTLHRLSTRPDQAHTVVNQGVEAAALIAEGRFRGLVNGVLRNYLRHQDALELDAAAAEEVVTALPAWWLQRLKADHPQAWPQIAAMGQSAPPMGIRVNRRRLTVADYLQQLDEAGIAARPLVMPTLPGDAETAAESAALLLPQAVPAEALPGFSAGLVSVQDGGAQRAAQWLGLRPGQRVLDACAAPGGKTCHILETADVRLTALEVDPKRALSVESQLARLGLAAAVRTADCRAVDRWWDGKPFDRILADVPCSASGVVRRHPDAKWLRREGDIAAFAATQREILEALWPLLAPGGRLLYATCSLFAQENQAQIARFLTDHPEARCLGQEQLLPDSDHDGFFYALLAPAV